ncbi:MAG: NADH:ubiquinone reductase (Na(+)-transporting) subunit C [Bacteroidales bacterium]|nr:NADH:ubiquinone reductase (Na(+)-transporting) subunit C [Bacteroidales bacterium]MDD4298005.1 NADH:ubiquinone reductase (Na(+)-transporting) subunit C [Ruminiclostridium sp.]
MNKNSNLYTIIYSTVLVVVVAGILAFVSSSLKSKQQDNVALEKMQSILSAAHLGSEADVVADKASYIKDLYAKHITNSYILNNHGTVVPGEAFQVDLKSQYQIIKKIMEADDTQLPKLKSQLLLPVYVCTIDNQVLNIFPCYGAGLWGAIWGYISVKDDYQTVYGAVFDHKSETPGLGAEISKPKFYDQFDGKKLFKDDSFISISIVKGGGQSNNPYGVDAISGGTITSKSLEKTIAIWLKEYLPYFDIKREAIRAENSPCEGGTCTLDTLIVVEPVK